MESKQGMSAEQFLEKWVEQKNDDALDHGNHDWLDAPWYNSDLIEFAEAYRAQGESAPPDNRCPQCGVSVPFCVGAACKAGLHPWHRLNEMREAMQDCLSLVEFYAEREMNAPANNQEAVRDTREKLARYRAALDMTLAQPDSRVERLEPSITVSSLLKLADEADRCGAKRYGEAYRLVALRVQEEAKAEAAMSDGAAHP